MNPKEVNIENVLKFMKNLVDKHHIGGDPHKILSNSIYIARDGYVSGWNEDRRILLEQGMSRLEGEEFGLGYEVIVALRKACEELVSTGDITFE